MNIIVIGYGMVGYKFLECLVESGVVDINVIIFCEELCLVYDCVYFFEFFVGKSV